MKIFYHQKLYHQIVVLVLVIIVSAFFAFGWLIAGNQAELMRKIMTESSIKLTKGLAESCVHFLLISDYSGIDQLLEKFIHMSGARGIQLYRADGKLLSEASITPSDQSLGSLFENQRKIPDSEKVNITIRDDIMIISNPVISVKVIGWVHIIFSLDNINEMRWNIWKGTAFATLFWMVFSILIFMVFFRRLTDTIQRLSNFARDLGNIKGEKVDTEHSSLEITQLCLSLNHASADLFAKEQELITYRDNLEKLVETRTMELEKEIFEREKSEKNFKTLFHKMLDGFALHEIIVDEAGVPVDYRFLAVNPAFERMTGLKAEDIIGHTVLDIMPDTEMRWIETYGRVALTGEPVHFEDFATALQKYFKITAYRPAPGQFACVVMDVTEKKQADEENKSLQVQLQHAQKMEAIGTLAGGIAHDFNNILGAVLGYAEMVQDDISLESRTRHDIDQVVKASHRAKELVKQILNFSRQAATEQIPLHPASIVKEAVKMLRSSLPSTIDIQQDVDQEAGLILADPTQIHQVLVNLCTNALHSMEETGGKLTISLKKTTFSKTELASEPQVQPGDFMQLSVGDTGSGITPEIQKKMFDPYFTTKEVGKGTGMGLAIIHGITKSYKGFVNYDSKLGEGTVFHVYLPIIKDPALLEIEPITFDIPLLGNERILFIDDEELLADVGKAMLERLGYRVTVRRNSIEALSTFQNQPDQFDLVITDQTMPGMTGSDLARRMLQIRPGMPIILCTGYSSLMSEEKALLLGIKGFAFKPLAKNDLAALIRKALDGEHI